MFYWYEDQWLNNKQTVRHNDLSQALAIVRGLLNPCTGVMMQRQGCLRPHLPNYRNTKALLNVPNTEPGSHPSGGTIFAIPYFSATGRIFAT